MRLSTFPARDMVRLDLEPTPTYARRWAYWFPPSEAEYAEDRRLGTLRIDQQKGQRKDCRVESDIYAVERVDQRGTNKLGFYLLNVTDPTQADVYHCRPAGAVYPALVSCTCKAGSCKQAVCKHRSALAELIASGVV